MLKIIRLLLLPLILLLAQQGAWAHHFSHDTRNLLKADATETVCGTCFAFDELAAALPTVHVPSPLVVLEQPLNKAPAVADAPCLAARPACRGPPQNT